jgi:hypothetical protein
VKVRAIAAQLTTLMCSTPSSTEAITRFDRLLDEVALSLQSPPALTTRGGTHRLQPPQRRRRAGRGSVLRTCLR